MPLYTAPFEELSTLIVAAVPPFHPEMVPSSVQNIKLALVVPMRNTVVELENWPETGPGPAGLAAPGGMVTFKEAMVMVAVALVEYTVANPVPLSLTQNGEVADSAIPQGFTRLGSVKSATPGVSATKLC